MIFEVSQWNKPLRLNQNSIPDQPLVHQLGTWALPLLLPPRKALSSENSEDTQGSVIKHLGKLASVAPPSGFSTDSQPKSTPLDH